MTFLWAADRFNQKSSAENPLGISPGVQHFRTAGWIEWSDHGRGRAACRLSPQDRSVEAISSITLDIQATPPPSSGGLCSLEIDWKCEMPSQHILYSLSVDFWHYSFFSVFAYLWQSCDNLEWQSLNRAVRTAIWRVIQVSIQTEKSNQLFDELATNLLPIFMSPLGLFVTSLASPLNCIWCCHQVQIQVCQYYVYIKTLRKLTLCFVLISPNVNKLQNYDDEHGEHSTWCLVSAYEHLAQSTTVSVARVGGWIENDTISKQSNKYES